MTSDIAVPPAVQPAPEAPQRKSGLQRLTGVLFAPVETFRDIAARPDILTPLIAIVLISIVMTILTVPKIDFETMMREQMEQSSQNMAKEDQERAVRFTTALVKAFAYVSPLLNLIFFAIIAGVLLLAFRLMGGEGTYKQAFSVSLYAWVPLLILGIIGTVVLFGRGTVSADEMGNLVLSNPGFVVDAKAQPILASLLSAFDIFTIWSLVLFIIGFSFVSRFSYGKSAAIVLTLWIVLLVFRVGFAALGAAKAAGA